MSDSKPKTNKSIIIFYTDAGGGHKSVSTALQHSLQTQNNYKVSIVNIYESILDHIDPCKKLFNRRGEQIFNQFILKSGIGRLFQLMFKYPANFIIRLSQNKIKKALQTYLKQHQPDCVISTIPLLNRAISKSCQELKVNMLTVVTDFGCRKGFDWVFKQQTHPVLLPTPIAYQHALKHQVKPDLLHELPGLIVKENYYQAQRNNQQKGSEQNSPICILVMMGALGSTKFFTIAKSLNKVNADIKVIFVCGHNEKLKRSLSKLNTRYTKEVLGFVDSIHYFQQCDIFIGKPGPTCVTEALMLNTPMILEQNCFTLEQEHDVANFVKQHRYGLTIRSFKHCDKAINQLLVNDTFNQYQKAIVNYHNNGLKTACEKIDGWLN